VNLVKRLCIPLLCAASGAAHGEALATGAAACATRAAEAFQIPRLVIAAVWAHENGRVGVCSPPNANGTRDCGPMQVNTVQIADYAAFGVTLEGLRDDACVNFAVAAHLLRRHHAATGSWEAAVGRYHSRTPPLAERYLGHVRRALGRVASWDRAR